MLSICGHGGLDEFDVFKVSRVILEAVTGSTDDDNNRDLEMVHLEWKTNLNEKMLQKSFVFRTRSKEVASSTMRSEEYCLQQLQGDDCWKLIAKYAFQDDDPQPNPDCREIGMKIVKKSFRIVSIGADFHGNNSCSFKSLETLHFSYMKGHLPEQVVPLKLGYKFMTVNNFRLPLPGL
ncbi:unnamed protein product [Sphenostylis stenocarpa]|uniref:Uncharacterized protein n=1 Tax=Sphenostylis stenocarpa TaxID=92480 RepID=A0AA86W4W2_9FABA|nr:unnamed protein product [Sphenostylis stenocarpa]